MTVRVKLQALVYDILPSTTAVFSYDILPSTTAVFSYDIPPSTTAVFSYDILPSTTAVFSYDILPSTTAVFSYDILPSTTAVFSYTIGSRKLSANEQLFVGAQTVVGLLQTTQIKQGVSFIAVNKVYTSTNKTTMV